MVGEWRLLLPAWRRQKVRSAGGWALVPLPVAPQPPQPPKLRVLMAAQLLALAVPLQSRQAGHVSLPASLRPCPLTQPAETAPWLESVDASARERKGAAAAALR